jgi:protein-arginine kinase activator protein McsA
MACDMCGKVGANLDAVNDSYKTGDIQHICSDCSKVINDQLWAISKIQSGFAKTFIKRYMMNKKLNITKGIK